MKISPEAILKDAAFLQLLLNSNKEAIILTDINSKIVLWNGGAEKLY